MNIASMTTSLTLSLLLLCTAYATAQELSPFQKLLANDGAQGQDFWLCVPPNEKPDFPHTDLTLQLASSYDCNVTVEWAFDGSKRTYALNAGESRILSTIDSSVSWAWEVWEAEQIVAKGVHVTSTRPITVMVMNEKITTTEGYLAIPVSQWGKKYRVSSYYDFHERPDQAWGGGFAVVAAENATVITIGLQGQGGSVARTSGGKRIGDVFTLTMNKGDVYRVVGDATTRGIFDLTGSLVRANKPIGMISYHERTTMPNLLIDGDGRNHLVEMNQPISHWGKTYITRSFLRPTDGKGKGDVFRVVASEDNTKWQVKWYDPATKQLMGQDGGVLAKAGDFADRLQTQSPSTLVNGISVFISDKPIHVTQYSCSHSWDNSEVLDPFMIDLTPVEAYTPASICQPATGPNYNRHQLCLIVEADTTSPTLIDGLKSVTVNGVAVWNHPKAVTPMLLNGGTIPGTSCYMAMLTIDSHVACSITSNGSLRLGGYIYGYGNTDAYGLPLSSGRFVPAGVPDAQIYVSDIDFGTVAPGTRFCKTFVVSNPGKVGLIVTGITGLEDPFTFDPPALPFPISIAPGSSYRFTICFSPATSDTTYTANIGFFSNAGGGDSVGILTGTTTGVSSVNDVGNEAPVLVPVPAAEAFSVTVPERYGAIRMLIVRDLTGNIRYTMNDNDASSASISASCATLASGTYAVEVQCSNGTFTTTLVVQR